MRYGLIGEKLGHSFSKEIHERIASYTYDLIPLSQEEFHDFMKKKEFTAINVTIPYKKAVLPYLDELDDGAKAIGAVNTVVNRDGKLYGYNTDYTGFSYMVTSHNIHMAGKKVLIIGNGGASAAIQAVVKKEAPKDMVIVDIVSGHGAISYEECYEHHLDAQIIINTSPIGMYPRILNAPIDIRMFHNCEAIMDVTYNPLLTRLCLDAQTNGIQHVSGLEMLIAQAKQSVEHFLDTSVEDRVIDEIYQDMVKERCNLVLIGMPSAGKTTIGKQVAQRMQKEFIDMDEEIVKKAGMSIPEIFAQYGESGFRCLETEVALALAMTGNKVIATGGGIVKYEVNMEYLRHNGIVIGLDRSLDRLISTDTNRPLSSSQEAVKQLYEERMPLYQQYAHRMIRNDTTITDAVSTIEEAVPALLVSIMKGIHEEKEKTI